MPKGSPGSTAADGHLILSNHSSYVDVIYLQYRFSPVFLATPTAWEDVKVTDKVIVRDFFGALFDVGYNPSYTPSQVRIWLITSNPVFD